MNYRRQKRVCHAPFEGSFRSGDLFTGTNRRFRGQFCPLCSSLAGRTMSSPFGWLQNPVKTKVKEQVQVAAHTSAWVIWHDQWCLFTGEAAKLRIEK